MARLELCVGRTDGRGHRASFVSGRPGSYLRAALPYIGGHHLSLGISVDLLERDGERGALAGAIAESRAEGRIAVVLGEPGIGKTALVSAVCEELPRRVLWGACDPLITPRPWGPVGPADHAAPARPAARRGPRGRRPDRRRRRRPPRGGAGRRARRALLRAQRAGDRGPALGRRRPAGPRRAARPAAEPRLPRAHLPHRRAARAP